MKQLLSAAVFALLCVLGTADASAQFTAITAASNSISIRGTVIATGTVVGVPVRSDGYAVAVTRSGGGLDLAPIVADGLPPVGYSAAMELDVAELTGILNFCKELLDCPAVVAFSR